MLDYAGGTVVHMSSGWAALVAAIICGPRQTIDPAEPPEGHNIPFFTLGAALLWFGWFGHVTHYTSQLPITTTPHHTKSGLMGDQPLPVMSTRSWLL